MSVEAAIAGAAIGGVSSIMGGSKDDPDLQPWKPVGHGLKRNFFPQVDDFAAQYGGGEGLYGGTRIANLDNIQNSMDWQRQLLPGLQRNMTQASRGIQGFMDYDPNSPINQARRESFSDQAMANFNQNLRPAIEDRSTFAGQFGGPQSALAMASAAQGVTRDINEFEAQMMENDRARALQATALAPSIFQAQLGPTDRLMDLARQDAGIRQVKLDDSIQMQESDFVNQLRAMQATQGLYAPFSGLASSGGSGGGNWLQGALGGAALGSQFDLSGLFGSSPSGAEVAAADWGPGGFSSSDGFDGLF